MVCIYCGSPTSVKNSRAQRQNNHIWRRRYCLSCHSIFTTTERPELICSMMVRSANTKKLAPFSRDDLFLTIYDSCRHRPAGVADAGALTQIITNALLDEATAGLIERDAIVRATRKVLERFDNTAAAIYSAYHHLADA